VTSGPDPVFPKFLTQDPGPKETRIILPESTPDPVPPLAVMCPSNQSHKPFESESSESHLKFFESSQSRVVTWSSGVRASPKNCRVTSSHWFASSSQCQVTWYFTFFLWDFLCYDMAPFML